MAVKHVLVLLHEGLVQVGLREHSGGMLEVGWVHQVQGWNRIGDTRFRLRVLVLVLDKALVSDEQVFDVLRIAVGATLRAPLVF